MYTWKERYLAAACHQQPDILPVAPETFFYIPVQVCGLTCQQVAPVGLTLAFHQLKTWEAQLECARYFDMCGWIMPAVPVIHPHVETEVRLDEQTDGAIEARLLHHTRKGVLEEKFWFPVNDAAWHTGRCVKSTRDWEPFLDLFFDEEMTFDFQEAETAWKRTGGQGIVSLYVGSPFIDWLCGAREGGYQTVIMELLDKPTFFRGLQARYLEYIRVKTRQLCEQASFDELFIGNEFSEIPLLSPRLWREWDYPVLKAFCDTARAHGKLTHWHQHGSTRAILPDFANSGLDILCPLEAPPGGDAQLGDIKRLYGDRLCLKGNISTHLLLNGTPEQVDAAVRECIHQAGAGGAFILGTGDQVAYNTPFENIHAFVRAGIQYSNLPDR
jgi:hypothetical protein